MESLSNFNCYTSRKYVNVLKQKNAIAPAFSRENVNVVHLAVKMIQILCMLAEKKNIRRVKQYVYQYYVCICLALKMLHSADIWGKNVECDDVRIHKECIKGYYIQMNTVCAASMDSVLRCLYCDTKIELYYRTKVVTVHTINGNI